MDGIALQRHEVVGARAVDGPVLMSIASRGPRRRAIDLIVGDCHAVRGTRTQDDVLAANQRRLHVVDPDLVRAVEGDRIAAPDIMRIQVGDVDVLDDDVADAGDDAEALAHHHAAAAFADDGFVGGHGDAEDGSVVV